MCSKVILPRIKQKVVMTESWWLQFTRCSRGGGGKWSSKVGYCNNKKNNFFLQNANKIPVFRNVRASLEIMELWSRQKKFIAIIIWHNVYTKTEEGEGFSLQCHHETQYFLILNSWKVLVTASYVYQEPINKTLWYFLSTQTALR